MLCTHNLDEAERLCDRVAFVRGEVLRIDSPARLRTAAGTTAVVVTLAASATPALLAGLRAVPGVGAIDGNGSPEIVRVQVSDPVRDTPALVRALVAAARTSSASRQNRQRWSRSTST